MSSQSDSAAAELIALASVLYQANHCIIGSTFFLIYDYAITLGREVNLFWTHKYTGASILFFTNRYVTLTWNVMGLAQLAKISEQFYFGLTGVTDPEFGCFASTNLTHDVAVKYVSETS
ncbi:hypothetical protein GSI_12521 [Ganoderma sinense ZZ0214-1]|uniref:DUF6533 domain-containing protein n=1 Tax=Ganoderma sinense ZZ0214-1 TaxID=1077348 RepID=A0A2G8RSZ5_9APHY|nr:hypothetical protein GSI_12521 [Ganoderma sinense ZZ0214-1]